ncbi:MAG: 3-methyl-2-oxobutanoate hydroxymethyltransferase [Chthoniobacter sp.]|nr:3-methyl-2-oxobutanoate hydroxymethyltransferase [Chthoniobacter sp.]
MDSRIPALRSMKDRGEKITVLTAYDYPLARLLDESGVDVVLVGDSLGMVVLGFPDTTSVTMEHMLHHTAAVARGVKQALVVADLPFASYDTPERALQNSHRLIEAGAQAVKLEGGVSRRTVIGALSEAGIPVMAHIGMLPQSVRVEGGYKTKGKTAEEVVALLEDARAVEAAGAFAVVLELVLSEVSGRITGAISIPTIGIGAGAGCDGQVLVTHDLVGLFPWFTPKFVLPESDIASTIRAAASAFVKRTKAL